MTSFADSMRRFFGKAAIQRGAAILDSVEIEDIGGNVVRAVVQGTHLYDVTINLDGNDPGDCDCMAFYEYGPCKHMWATILAVETAARLGELPARFAGELAMEVDGGTVIQHPAARPRTRARGRNIDYETERRLQRMADAHRGAVAPEPDPLLDRVCQVHWLVLPGFSADGLFTVLPTVRLRLKSGEFGVPKRLLGNVPRGWLPSPEDEALLPLIPQPEYWDESLEPSLLPAHVDVELLRGLARSGRLIACTAARTRNVQAKHCTPIAVTEDATDVVDITCDVGEHGDGQVALSASLAIGDRAIERELVHAASANGSLVIENRLASWRSEAPSAVVLELLEGGPIVVPADRGLELRRLIESPPVLAMAPPPDCQLQLDGGLGERKGRRFAVADLIYLYGSEGSDEVLFADDAKADVFIGGTNYRRNRAAEGAILDRLVELGCVLHWDHGEPVVGLLVKDLVPTVMRLLEAGIDVWAANLRVRRLSTPSLNVRSGVDFFELEAQAADPADGAGMRFPELLAAIHSGDDGLVRLGDGEVGILDSQDLQVLARLATLGEVHEDGIRFDSSQGMLLDAMLDSSQADVEVDREFAGLRERCRADVAAKSVTEPKGFGATLRPYQREGLGWFRFLQDLGVGGCLADDMGLGKTVQVLALLEQQRRKRSPAGPSLVVAPKSLVFHWQREAARFAPKLHVLPFVGTSRFKDHVAEVEAGFAAHDLVLTTYGSLRNDVPKLTHVEWNYVILDEAQAIKNDRSQAAKAVRLCNARHRLALSGTPIENHLGELWSLFEFLNPGMLGASKAFRDLLTAGAKGPQEDRASFTDSLRRAVRPFLLRRTKEQVLDDLPAKTVQVLDCELPPRQRKAYDELATFYRAELLGQLGDQEIPGKKRFEVLEALLRLRQAACHPGLLDDDRKAEACAKFDVLLPMLEELRDEGHKALVFSQFPSFLRLLRDRLDADGVDYAYLDGRTRKREAQVDRFQSDPDCSLFLISIKAGGHGLNLTAASYVFLLDPWWNPAVEAQAIDRCHRIGQDKHVNAYRLICRDTVEERVAELQASKRALADAVLGDDRSVLQDLTAADVAALFG